MRQQDEMERERAFVERARAALDQRAHELNPPIDGRLRAARRTALEGAAGSRPRWLWASGLAVAATAVLAVFLWLAPPTQGPAPQLEDLELLSSSESLEFYEDLEFYDWLAQDGPTG